MTDAPRHQKLARALSPRIDIVPVVHGSADFSLALRRLLTEERYDCLAVPLPPSFQDDVEMAIRALPVISAVVQSATPEDDRYTYIPIDPCQPVIAALKTAREERMHRAFIDLECRDPGEAVGVYPDPYALRALSIDEFSAAVLPSIERPDPESFAARRARRMAFELHRLELEHERILAVTSIVDWPWVRDAYRTKAEYPRNVPYFAPIERYPIAADTLFFFLSELPWITHLYEVQRSDFAEAESLSIDGTKELIVEARDRTVAKRPHQKKRLSVKTLRLYLQYVRNLSLVRRRLRPDLFTMIEAAKQVMGDDFALELLTLARTYPEQPIFDDVTFRMGLGSAEHPMRGVIGMTSRLPGHAVEWRDIDLRPEPPEKKKAEWTMTWNPYSQCSWPPEDARIESFNLHVREQAKQMLSTDLARSEKFSSSMKDGLDIRETLRHWYSGDLFVKVLPPARGTVEVVVFLFDVPADPDKYPWRTTWFAEHKEESTLAFFATSFMEEMIGPGIGQSRYGGAMFLFPPRPVPDIWTDPLFSEAKTLEERLLAAAFFHSKERHVAVVSPCPMKASWRRWARRFQKTPIHLPLRRFSQETVERLRRFHVLNGREVRSYAADFIRRTE